MAHFTKDVETWSDHFLEWMEEFSKLSDIERESNKERSKKKEPPIDIDLGNSIYVYNVVNGVILIQLYILQKCNNIVSISPRCQTL